MNPEQQRIAIAEWCGWRLDYDTTQLRAVWISPKSGYGYGLDEGGFVPDYLNDLNAMHEAEKLLQDVRNNDQWSAYAVELNRICCSRVKCGNNPLCGYTIHAAAAQRAEALLRTIGKWTATDQRKDK